MLICTLACYLTWHLRRPGAADLHRRAPPARANPVAPARRSPSASVQAASKTGPGKQPVRVFLDLIDHLATLTLDTSPSAPARQQAPPHPHPAPAFDLILSLPLTLT